MRLLREGGFRILRLFGIDVFVHWTWLPVAAIELQLRDNAYTTMLWNAAEYLTLFGLVLLHEFGHALACRSVDGTADRIVLWPLGGVAYVNPPQRAGALLWSIVAGPLVNFVLLPITIGAGVAGEVLGPRLSDDSRHYLLAIAVINVVLLVFNLLPIYPLDGGQILRALLWFFVGPSRSLTAAALLGMLGAAGIVSLAVWLRDLWLVALALLIGLQSWGGLRRARSLATALAAPRHAGLRCSACQEAPPVGTFWSCSCGTRFDTFARQAECPRCKRALSDTNCPFCGRSSPRSAWQV